MAEASTREKTVLCVDDNEDGLFIRQAMLRTFGFDAHLATSGAAALEIMAAKRFDAVVLDYRMPEMDGAELTERIKHTYPETAVIMLTGYPHDVPPRTLQLVDAMLLKGEGPEQLRDTLLALTGSRFERQQITPQQMTERNLKHIQAVSKFLQTQRHRKH